VGLHEGESNDMGVGDSVVIVVVDVVMDGNDVLMGGANETGEVVGGRNLRW